MKKRREIENFEFWIFEGIFGTIYGKFFKGRNLNDIGVFRILEEIFRGRNWNNVEILAFGRNFWLCRIFGLVENFLVEIEVEIIL